jgi:hypothetical protein
MLEVGDFKSLLMESDVDPCSRGEYRLGGL